MTGNVSYLDLVLFPAFFVPLVMIMGNVLRHALRYIASWFARRSIEEPDISTVESATLDLSLGFTLVPLSILGLSAIGISLNQISILSLTALLASIYLLLHKKTFIDRLKQGTGGWNTNLLRREECQVAIVCLLALYFHLSPTLGLYVYPGGDPKIWAYMAQWVIKEGRYINALGPMSPAYVAKFDLHFLTPGLPSLVCFSAFLTGIDIGKLVLIITPLLNALGSLSVYCMSKRLSGGNSLVALFSAFSQSMLSLSTHYFAWGGNAEQSIFFFVPAVIWFILVIIEGRKLVLNVNEVLIAMIILTGSVFFHLYSLIYISSFLIPLVFYLIAKRKLKAFKTVVLTFFFAVLPVAIWFASRYALISASPVIEQEWISPNLQKVVIHSGLSLNESALALWNFLAGYHGVGIVVLTFLAFPMLMTKLRKTVILAFAWVLILFIISENNPSGLYFLPYPFWNVVYPFRIAFAWSLPLSVLAGVGLYTPIRIWRKLSEKVKSITFFVKGKISLAVPKILLLGLVMTPVLFPVSQQLISRNDWLWTKRSNSMVTEMDYAAFNWIRTNTPQDSVFFIMDRDAGAYIPLYAGRKVFPGLYVYMHLEDEVLEDAFSLISLMHKNPESLESIKLLNKYNVTHIYIGARTNYGLRLDPSLFFNSGIYRERYNDGGAFIFELLNKSVSFSVKEDFEAMQGWSTHYVNLTSNGEKALYRVLPSCKQWAYVQKEIQQPEYGKIIDLKILTRDFPNLFLVLYSSESLDVKKLNYRIEDTEGEWKYISISIHGSLMNSPLTTVRLATYCPDIADWNFTVTIDYIYIYSWN